MTGPAAAKQHYHLLVKPAGAACNLSCRYCFFLSKEQLYRGDSFLMTDAMLQTYIRQLMESSPGPNVEVAWQGGEPTLRGLDFFRRSVELASHYRKPHQRVQHVIQTNGTLIDDEWARFFKQNHYLVGLSVDGPRELHDAYRVSKRGKGTFDDVMRGWDLLRKHNVDVNILCTVHARNGDYPREMYRFFRDEMGARYVQFIPIVERATGNTIEAADKGWNGPRGSSRSFYRQAGDLVTRRSVTAWQFGDFLIAIFDEWIRHDVGKVFVSNFDIALGSWMGLHTLCTVAPVCGSSLVLEHNGDVYACDHFVEPGYLIGNISETPLETLVTSDAQHGFGRRKLDTLPTHCKRCRFLFACYGECPRNRFIRTPDGQTGLNYLCDGYKAFFKHVDKPMRVMACLARHGRFPGEVMRLSNREKKQLLSESASKPPAPFTQMSSS